MYLKCATEKTAKQQSCFEAALLNLMNDKDFEKISVVDICERAGITRRIFYRLFETKQDCLLAAIDHKIINAETYKSKLGYTGFCQMLEYIKEQKDSSPVISRQGRTVCRTFPSSSYDGNTNP